MAKACPVKICIAKDNISHQVLLESLQNLHIEAIRDILTSKDLTSSQLCHLSMEMQEKTKRKVSHVSHDAFPETTIKDKNAFLHYYPR